ncbi:unnamed protein product [Adineta ricciae]|uniref:Apple domain-containing protein n=1 Tax=Adineta ricciae TaxID=249248 RepID=A0A815TRR3_ADIRI|nr:unnamed protein product [Adineta ricciae]
MYQDKQDNREIIVSTSIAAIHWNGNWAFACDFYKNDLTDARIPGEQCGGRCAATSGCTHFTWTTYNGGTCWMKHGHARKENAFSTGDRSMVCGVVEQRSTDRAMYGVHTTRHGATEHGACALPASDYAVVNPVALGNIESLKNLKFRPELCGHVLNVDCGHGSLDIIVTNSNLGGGLDLYGSTWDKLTNHKPPGITSCKRNIGLLNTNGRIVVKATIDGRSGVHHGDNSYYAFTHGPIYDYKKVIFAFEDGGTHSVFLRDCVKQRNQQTWR